MTITVELEEFEQAQDDAWFTQCWLGKGYSLAKIDPIKNKFGGVNKPLGGLWTATFIDTTKISEWLQWCCSNGAKDWLDGCAYYLLTVKPQTRVYTIDSYADLQALIPKYGVIHPYRDNKKGYEYLINYEKFFRDYDALHLTDHGQRATRLPHFARVSPPYSDLYGWDCESTLWCDASCFIGVMKQTIDARLLEVAQ